MLQLSLTAALLSGSIWFGAMIFLSLVLAPTVFSVLSEQGASHLLRALFPRYYQLGIACGFMLQLSLIFFIAITGAISPPVLWSTIGSIVILLLSLYSLMLIPRINRARDAGSSMSKIFDQLHLRSVIINCVNILITLGVLINLMMILNQL